MFCKKFSATLLKKRLWHSCFPVNFEKFLRTPFYRVPWVATSVNWPLSTFILNFANFYSQRKLLMFIRRVKYHQKGRWCKMEIKTVMKNGKNKKVSHDDCFVLNFKLLLSWNFRICFRLYDYPSMVLIWCKSNKQDH